MAIDLKKQLGNLIELQTLDSQIYSLNEEKKAKPEEIKALEAAFEAKKQKLASLEKSSFDLQKQKKDKEGELAAREEGTKKLQSQLYSLKTNKEYQTMLQQIADSKADGSVIEDKILVIMDQIDKAKLEVEKEKQLLQQEEKAFLGQKKIIEDRIKEMDGKLAQLEAGRQQIIPGIDPGIFSQYEKVLANRNGLAIVRVKDESCLGCHMQVPPQVINLIKMYEKIIICDVCNRILYVEE